MKLGWRRMARWWYIWAAVLVGASPVEAQLRARRPFAEDYHRFRSILHAQGLQPLQALAELNESAQETLLIVLGGTNILAQTPGPGLREFIRDGGALLLATDRETVPLVGELFGAKVSGFQVAASAPGEYYRDLPDCPLIWKGNELFPPFRDLRPEPDKVIATNRPSYLTPATRGPNVPRLGSMAGAWYDHRWGGANAVLTFALVFQPDIRNPADGQRIVLLADHSIFINSMMLQRDNGNAWFTQNLVRWLTNDGGRKKVLFLDDGQVQKRLKVTESEIPDLNAPPLQHLPIPPMEVLNQLLATSQENDIFNRLILERFSMNQILSAAALWLSGGFLVYGFYRLWRARYLPDVHP